MCLQYGSFKIKTTYIVGLLSKQSTAGVAIVYKQNVNATAFTWHNVQPETD